MHRPHGERTASPVSVGGAVAAPVSSGGLAVGASDAMASVPPTLKGCVGVGDDGAVTVAERVVGSDAAGAAETAAAAMVVAWAAAAAAPSRRQNDRRGSAAMRAYCIYPNRSVPSSSDASSSGVHQAAGTLVSTVGATSLSYSGVGGAPSSGGGKLSSTGCTMCR
jgi:hypothetical protein